MKYYLGIDGGGTSCRMRLLDGDGTILGESQSGAANVSLGAERVLPVLDDCMGAVLSQANLSRDAIGQIHATAGMAGTEVTQDTDWLNQYFDAFASFQLYSDCHSACVGAFGGGDGALVITGTGTVGWAIKGDKHFRIGGWGFQTSDLYSGAWLGQQALRHANHAYDGLCDSTLSKAILNHFENDSRNIATWALTATPADYATFAPMVITHAEQGDALAQDMMQQAGDGVSKMANDLMNKSNTQHWCFVGGVSPAITPYLCPKISEKCVSIKGDALEGAILLAQS